MQFKKQHPSYCPKHPLTSSSFAYLPIPQRMTQQYYALRMNSFYTPQGQYGMTNQEGKGKWTAEEQSLYITYLEQNFDDMTNSVARKVNKVFLNMSRIIGTRSADQCRSHHQKILKCHNSVQQIIQTYKRRTVLKEEQPQKQLQRTGVEDQSISGFYQLKRTGNKFSLSIDQSAIQNYHL